MEKLIELLNEYETLKVGAKPRKILSDGTMYCDSIYGLETLYGELICGKPYGFIKWLVENDKIDKIKLKAKIMRVFEFRFQDYATFENALLMLLAIQDEPIEFLCSILK